MSLSTKVDLVDFQKRLISNLEAAKADNQTDSMVGFSAGGENWLIYLKDLKEVESVPAQSSIRKILLTKPWVSGISNFRGTIYTLLDFQKFLGFSSTSLDLNARVILLSNRLNSQAGFVVPEVLGIFKIGQFNSINASVPGREWVSELVEEKLEFGERTWNVINVEKLMNQREMLSAGQK